MRRPHVPDPHSRLLPAGRRWGFGAHSLLPYLNMALSARPGEGDANIRNPVFPQMEDALEKVRRRH